MRLPYQRRALDTLPARKQCVRRVLIALATMVFTMAVSLAFSARAGVRVNVQHPNWHLVCTLDTLHYGCTNNITCTVTVQCHGGTLFYSGFDS